MVKLFRKPNLNNIMKMKSSKYLKFSIIHLQLYRKTRIIRILYLLS